MDDVVRTTDQSQDAELPMHLEARWDLWFPDRQHSSPNPGFNELHGSKRSFEPRLALSLAEPASPFRRIGRFRWLDADTLVFRAIMLITYVLIRV